MALAVGFPLFICAFYTFKTKAIDPNHNKMQKIMKIVDCVTGDEAKRDALEQFKSGDFLFIQLL